MIGSGSLAEDDPREALAEELGEALVDAGYRVVCGAQSGVMAAAARGARRSDRAAGADVVGIVPSGRPEDANPWIDIAIPTSLGHYRNGIVAHGEAVVAIGGGAGTLAEMALAWVFDRPVLAFRVDGWSGKLADERIDDRIRFPGMPGDRVYGVSTAAEAVTVLASVLPP
ncbi:MAG: acyl-CoA synthetase [Myxococcota bacterium]